MPILDGRIGRVVGFFGSQPAALGAESVSPATGS